MPSAAATMEPTAASNGSWKQFRTVCNITEWDPSDVTYPPDRFKRVPPALAATKITVTSLVIVLALVGNCLVALTVWRCRRLRTPTNVYIVSLAVSDLMVTLSCTWVHLVQQLSEGWVLGAFFCVINTFAQGQPYTADCGIGIRSVFRTTCTKADA